MIQEPDVWSSDELTAEQRELFEQLLADEDVQLEALAPIPWREEADEVPLSFAQQRLWFLAQLEPDSAVYNVPAALRLTGPLDISALAMSLGEVVQRHEVLHTAIRTFEGEPRAEVAAAGGPFPMPVVDLSGLASGRRLGEAGGLADREALRPFDLAQAPLLRATLVVLAPAEHLVLLTMHHIVSDGWSVGVLVREMGALYEAFRQGHSSPLLPLPVQYADFAAWQRRRLTGDLLERQLSYGRERLAGAPPVITLPTDRPRPAVQSMRGARLPLRLPAALGAAVDALSMGEGATQFMTLLAAVTAWLHRHGAGEDLVIGSPIANRTRAELEGLIGFFANTVVLRTDLGGNPSWRALLARVREVTLGAYEHQDLPFEKLVEELAIGRDLSHNPLFQVMVALQNAPVPNLALGGLTIGLWEVDLPTARFDMVVDAEEERRWEARIEYATDLFDAATIERMAGHFEHLLAAVVEEPGRPLAELPLLSRAERHQITVEWSDSAAPPPAATLPRRFAAQAARTPEAPAVSDGRESWIYEELARRSAQLARSLRALGVGREIVVGLCLDRSVHLVAAALAVLRAGGAYLPLDPGFPAERLAFMAAEGGIKVLVCDERHREAVPGFAGMAVTVEELARTVAGSAGGGPLDDAGPDDLAYLLFTSGSTGRPKGVEVVHGALANFLASMAGRPGLTASDTLLAVTTLSFDIAGLELYLPLTVGARIVLADRETAADGALLGTLLERSGATVMQATPATWQLLLGAGWPGSPRLSALCGGEALPAELARLLAGRVAALWNLYGPTETTIWSAIHAVEPGHEPVPVGRPIANTVIRLLDTAGGVVPAGVPGELHIGGAGLARGYRNRPDLTAERFIPGALGGEPGARLYRTGDLARFRPGGEIEYLGRIDSQVKVRGFRIELGEIESALEGDPRVERAVVVARDIGPGDRRLVAYVVPRAADEDALVDPAGRRERFAQVVAPALRASLARALPDYMVPALFVGLETLPLTANGKVDRRALPAPAVSAEIVYVAPRDTAEEILAGLVGEVLGVDRVSIHDDFFALGGHSLLAMQLVARVRQTFGAELPVRRLFETPTVAGLAAAVAQELGGGAAAEMPPIAPAMRGAEAPLSFAQQLIWVHQQLTPDSTAQYIPGVVRLLGRLDVSALAASLAEVVRRHEVLRATFPAGGVVARVSPSAPVPLPIVDLAGLPGELRHSQAQRVLAAEGARLFDLTRGPLLRTLLLRLDAQEQMLAVTLHHIVADGWSLGLLLREVAALYDAVQAGRPSPLPELALQYADFAVWQRRWLSDEVLEQRLDFWRRQLSTDLPPLDLPADRPRHQASAFRGGRELFRLEPELSQKLRALARRQGATLFMTLLAAFEVLLSRLSGQEQFRVGSPVAGRERPELEELIGVFIETLVFEADLSGRPTFLEVLSRVRETALSAYAQQVPFSELLSLMDAGRTPLFQVLFNMLNLPRQEIRLAELTFETLPSAEASALFDWTLYAMDRSDAIEFSLVYDADLFGAARMREVRDQLVLLLSVIAESPGERIDRLPLLTAAARDLLPDPEAALATPAVPLLADLFLARARELPESPAVVQGEVAWSYADLLRRARAGIRPLAAGGMRSGEVVAVSGPRSPELIAGILSVVLAGGVLLMLDPRLPATRRRLLLERSGARHLLRIGEASKEISKDDGWLAELPGLSVLSGALDDATPGEMEEPAARLGPDDPAYVFFTSGTSGMPKAVLGRQKGLSHFLLWQRDTFGIGPEDRFAQLTGLSFDVVLRDIFLPLISGAALCLPDRDDLSPHYILPWMERAAVTALHTVPSLASVWLDAAPPGVRLASLRWTFFAGELLPGHLVDRWRSALAPTTRAVNLYGPTETTLAKCFFEVPAPALPGIQPVGRTLPQAQALVLSPEQRLCGVGEAGEIAIRTPFASLGYLDAPEEDRRRFRPNPFRDIPDDLLYFTGDRGRYRPDGTLEVLGRLDDQIKIRGMRVEPAEVAAVLTLQPGVRDCAVVAREDASGDKRLVAYVVLAAPEAFEPAGLLLRLRRELPDYMVPSAFVALSSLPLTPNGKLDRRALPAPDDAAFPQAADEQAPSGPVEEVIAALWESVLGVQRVGAQSDFFALGGHSLLAMQLSSRLRESFGVDLPLREVFESSTVAALARAVERALGAATGQQAPAGIEKTPRGGLLPLSFAQQRLWFLDQLQPESAAYNIARAFQLDGALDVAAFFSSLDEVVRRHETLRTTFTAADGEARQVIAAARPGRWSLVDLSALPAAVSQEEAERLATEEARRPFDLARGPLIRAALLHLGGTESTALLTTHHIISDGWSAGIFLAELTALYEALVAGRPSPLPELPVQYADFASWQRRRLTGEVLAAELAHWRRRLGDVPPVLDLPTDRSRPSVRTMAGARRRAALPADLLPSLRALGRQAGTTLFMTVLAAFDAVLGRTSGQTDFPVGTPIAGRGQVETEKLIGFFVNMLVLRADLSGDPSFSELLRRVRGVTLDAYMHAEVPFEKLVDELQPRRDLSQTPLFQVVFQLQNAVAEIELPGLRMRLLEPDSGTAMFDLRLGLAETPAGLAGFLEYDTSLWDAPTMEHLLGHFGTLLAGAVATPGRRLSELPLLGAGERAQVVVEWNDTHRGLARVPLLQTLFEESASRSPEAVAVVSAAGELTYRELEARANRLAHLLRARGAGRGRQVAVLLDRSAEMVVAVLGILKAGAAYIPLETRTPQDRMAWILESMDVPVIVTGSSRLAAAVALAAAVPCVQGTVCLDGPVAGVASVDPIWGADDLAVLPAAAPEPSGEPDDPAYVIFTSGSTGRPKGVLVRHRPVINLIDWANRSFALGPADRVLFITSLGFDLSVYDIFGLLAAGGSLRVASGEEVEDPQQLARILVEEPITFWDSAPAALAQVVPFLPAQHHGDALRLVFLSGDWIPLSLPGQMSAVFGGARIIALGGATEATVWSNWFQVEELDPDWRSIPYGRPIQNAAYYVLDPMFHPCPIGVPGDLFIGGDCLATGYAGAPVLTAAQFMPDPFDGRRGAVMYRTGDRARFRRDGNLEFLGRLDAQVKIRGFRVELGEIESVLKLHPAVAETVAVVREDRPGDRRIVAYLVPVGGLSPALDELRGQLRERLPEYMQPAALVVLDALPLTANGKVDRKALPAPSWSTEEAHMPPQGPVEEALAAIWREVLGHDRIGANDNFFELGGDSILAIQVISRASRVGLRLTPRQLFENPTIAGLATVVLLEEGDAVAAPVALAGPVPLSPIQRWFFTQGLPHPEHFNQAVLFDVGSAGAAQAALLERALGHLLAHHPAFSLRFDPSEGGEGWRQQTVGGPGATPFTWIDLAAVPAQRWTVAVETTLQAIQASLDLSAGPLLRAALLTAGAGGPARLFLAIHHLVVDGVSWRILLEDLEIAWRQIERGEEVALPPVTTPFQIWAERLAGHSREVLSAADFWRESLSGAIPRLPLDSAAGDNTAGSARTLKIELTAEETRALLSDVPRAYRTQINDVLLTAVAEAFAGWTGSRRVLVDLEGHGREGLFEGIDLSRTVGWLTAIHPVCLDLTGAAGPGAALKAVKEQLRAIPGNGLPFGLLTEALAGLPKAEVLFNYFGQLGATISEGFLRPAPESAGATRHPRQPRPYLLEINVGVVSGRLQVAWTYSTNRHREESVAHLAEELLAALRSLISHCLTPGAGGVTPSDFPLALTGQATLDQLVAAGPVDDLYPASQVQHGMIFHTLHSPGSGVYIEQLNLILEGLEPAPFQEAWKRVTERHTVLRTGFFWTDRDVPLQVVRPVEPTWEMQDWRGLSTAARDERLTAWLTADRRRGFDLATPPLFRLALFQLGEGTYRFVWTFHHVFLDGWSLPLLLRDLFALYEGSRQGIEARLERPRPYRDYIAWISRSGLEAAEGFWRHALAGFTASTPLAVDRLVADAGEADEQGTGLSQVLLSAAEDGALRAFARQHQLTLNTLVQGAWALLLERYSGEQDVVFGAVTSGRSAPVPGIDGIVGLFLNTLPARVRIVPTAALLPWLAELQAQQAETRQHEHSPLSLAQAASDVPRGRPLFESILAFENYPVDTSVEEHAEGRLRITEVALQEQTNYPLNVIVTPRPQLTLKVGYERRRFDAASIERLLGHLQSLLAAFLAQPEGTLDSFPLLTCTEAHQALHEWNDTARACPQEPLVHELFAAHARRRPESMAVSLWDGRRLTYGELDAQANRLAHHLRRQGVGPDVLVALCTDRTPERLVGIVAVLKAGGAYVSLDPTHPVERLAFMLEDAAAPVILTQERFRGVLPATQATVLSLDTDLAEILGDESEPPVSGVTPDNLSYVVYTSGSTGRPKGVEIPHAGLMNLVRWHQGCYGVTDEDRGTQIASPAFDASIWELWPYLAAGASVHIPDEETRLSSPGMIRWWAEQGITLAYLMTPLAEGVLGEEIPAGLEPPTRALIIGGDRLHRRPAPGVRFKLMNHYGPAEYSVTSTVVEVPKEGGGKGLPTIGRPVDNTRIYILDQHLNPVPAGVPGELFVGGIGIARGYLHRPGMTAEKFIPDPFAAALGEPGARVYRTGDLVRYLPDGDMDFLGRLDHQVKIRGLRIELSEIEAVFGEHPGVREGVVLVREDRPGDRRLVGYFVAVEVEPAADDLRAFLRERLPEYMIPAAFVAMDALPMTPNGKVDRRALPAPEWTATAVYTAPRGPVEEALAAIWSEVLKVERVGADDSFFELGGDSILSIQVISRAARAGLRIIPRQLFENPTIAALAPLVEAMDATSAESGPAVGPVELTPIQRRFFALRPVHPEHFNLGLLLEVAPADGGRERTASLLARALEHLLQHHDALRMRYAPTATDPADWQQSIEESVALPWTEIDLGALPAAACEAAMAEAAAEVQTSLDLTVAPLLRAAFFRFGDSGPDRLLWAVHHLVVDAVSWRILLEDLEAAYRQLARGGEVALPPRTASFQRWAARLAELARSPQTEEAGERWIARFAEAPPPVPADSWEGESTAGSIRHVNAGLDPAETRALLKEAPRAYRTQINDLLLAALAAALGRFTGGRRVLFDLEGHGRDENLADGIDVSRTVGWFTTINPVLLDLGAGPGEGGAFFAAPGETLKSVKEQLRTLAADASSYGLLRYLGKPGIQAALAALPASEVLFNYLGQLDGGASGVSGASGAAGAALVRPATGPVGPQRHPAQTRAHLLEINSGVQNGRLEMVWSYSEGRHRRETVERLAADFVTALRELVAHCLSVQAGGATPSDFPLAGLTQPALDRILAEIKAIEPGAVLEDLYPATPAQQGMLFHSLQSPDSGVYIEQVKLTLTGLDVAAFERAWRRVVDRHPILRTAWLWHDLAEPLQAVHHRVDLPFDCEDWRGASEAEQEARLTAWLAADSRRGFDVSRPPLLRLTVMRCDERTWRFVWTFHHMLLDGWSMAPLLRDLFTLYAAERAGVDAVALEPVRPYRDYIAWLRRQDLAAAERAWRRALAGFTAPTPLALARPAVPVDTAEEEPGRLLAHLSVAATDGLKAFARRHQLTLNTVIQGCWALLLGRYAGEDDVVFGIVTSGRSAPLPGIHGMVGLFLNTLPVRVTMPPGERLAAWLRRLQEEQVELREYDYTPLVQVQAWSEVPPGRPLFESLFAFENYPIDESVREQAVTGLEVGAAEMLEKTNFPLHLIVSIQEQLRLRVFYDRRRFAEEAMVRLLGHLEALCASLLASAESLADPLLDELSFSGAEELALLPDPAAPLPEPPFPPVSRLFLERAAETPGAPAVKQGGVVWSYAELRRRATAVARHLAGHGVAPGEVVAVDGSSSLDLIATLLGVLLARGAFLILDRKLAAPRRRLLIERSAAHHLIRLDGGEAEAGEDLEAESLPTVALLRLDPGILADQVDRADQETGGAPELVDPGPDDPAYVFFTSGTTGTPKAILGRQRGLSHFLSWQRDTFGIGAGDRVAQLTGLNFDVVLRDIFLPLISGATLCILGGDDRSPERVLPWLAEEAVTALHTVPSLAGVWLDGVPAGLRLPALRWAFLAGEPLFDHLVRRWRAELAPESAVVNLYGPTETTLAKCFYRVPDPPAPGVQPIGEAMPSAQALVLATGRRRCAVGEAGEIVIRTPFRSLGYLDASDEDRRRFRPNPFRDDAGDLLYFTGDRGRYRADGVLEILGRLDDQVKIRGMRVEPGEVRAVLLRQEGVRECAVVAREDGLGDLRSEKRLVAYVVPVEPDGFDVAAVRSRLRRELPDYMVPAAVMVLAALPLTPNGKLDRRALPAPEGSRADHLGRYVAPRNRAELELVALWEDLLGVRPVGVRDDFFEIGGHSLLAMRLVARIQERFGRSLPLASLLAAGTVEELAAVLQREEGAGFASPVVPLRASGSRQRFFCVHPGGGGVLCYRDLAGLLGPEQPFFAFQARGLDGEPAAEEARMEDIARTYIEAMRRIEPHGPYLLGGWSFGGLVAFEMARQLDASGERSTLILFDTPAPGVREQADEFANLAALAGEAGLAVDEDELRRLTPQAQLDRLVELAVATGALPREGGAEVLRRMLAVYRAHHYASRTYTPSGAYPGPLTIVRASERLNDEFPGLTAGEPDSGWSRYCAEPPAVVPVPGNHLTMVRPPHVEALANVLTRLLARLPGREEAN